MNLKIEKTFCDNFLEKRIKDRIFLNLVPLKDEIVHFFDLVVVNLISNLQLLFYKVIN